MSVIVKGMEMPKNCGECPFIFSSWGIEYYCHLAESSTSAEYVGREKMTNCPLIELPPHGRLIAEKTITEIRYHDADGYHIVNGEQLCELEIDAETVIEAEGETE